MGFFAWVGDPDIATLETVGVVLLLAAAPFVHVNVQRAGLRGPRVPS